MTERAIPPQQTITITTILNKARTGQRSIADHDIAIRRPLAELVEATITASCNSPHTARNYRRGIGEFITLLGRERFDGTPLVDRFQHGKHNATIFDYGETPAAVLLLADNAILDKFNREHKQAAYAVKTLLAVALRDNILTQPQAVSMGIKPYRSRTRRNEKPAGRRLSVLEVQSLRASVDTSTNGGKRDLATLDLMLFAGLRRQEVAELSLSDFHQDDGRGVIVLTGKGGKVRKVAVHKTLFSSLSEWLQVYSREFGDSAPVFTRVRKGGAVLSGGIGSQAISDMVARYGHGAGLAPLAGTNRLTPHDARRTFARRLHDCGASLAAIQRLLGHSDVKTTIRYIGLNETEAQDAVDLLSYG